MSFVESTSNIGAKYLTTKVPNNDQFPTIEDQIEVYAYGLMVIIGALVKGVLLITISSLLGVLIPAIIITLTFSSLRIIAGGYHLKTFNKCMVFSLLQFTGSALIVQYTYQYWSFMNIWYLFNFCVVMCLYIIFRYVPRDTPNKPITEESEIKKFKRWSFKYLFTWVIIMIIFLILNLKIIIISSCFGLLLELFSISKIGYNYFYSSLDK